MDVAIRVAGLPALLEKERTFGAKTDGILTDHLLEVGRAVAIDTSDRYMNYSPQGAAGVQEKVFTSGLWVVQTIRKSSHPLRRRPTFGPLMMRKAFLPAAADNQERTLQAAELAVTEAAALYWDN